MLEHCISGESAASVSISILILSFSTSLHAFSHEEKRKDRSSVYVQILFILNILMYVSLPKLLCVHLLCAGYSTGYHGAKINIK